MRYQEAAKLMRGEEVKTKAGVVVVVADTMEDPAEKVVLVTDKVTGRRYTHHELTR